MTSTLGLEGISFAYPGGVVALERVDLDVARGELLTIVGPSGSGKTTLLKIAAGLEHPSEGRVLLDGENATTTPPRDRDVAVIFQGASLYPQLSVAANLAFGLKVRGVPRRERRSRTQEIAALLGLEDVLDRKPAALSGGQERRVALGKALVRRPRIFLLDEPLDGLDLPLRRKLRREIRELHDSLGVTTILVTHDQEEALALGDRVGVLQSGRIHQVAAPDALYRDPADTFVAEFLGLLPMNFLRAELRRHPGGTAVEAAGTSLAAPSRWTDALGSEPCSPVRLGIRPEDVILSSSGGSGSDLRGRVVRVESLGSRRLVHVLLSSAERLVCSIQRGEPTPPEAAAVSVRLDLTRAHAFATDGGGRNLTLSGA
jgi:ABC-type sugar transport system ATPase subunit